MAGLRRLELSTANPSHLVDLCGRSLQELIVWKLEIPRQETAGPAPPSGQLPPEPVDPFPRLAMWQLALDVDIWEPREFPVRLYPWGTPVMRTVPYWAEQDSARRLLRWLATPEEMPRLRKVAVVLSSRLINKRERHTYVDQVKRVLVDAGSRQGTRVVEVLVPQWSKFADRLCQGAATENPHVMYEIVGPRLREEVPQEASGEDSVSGGGGDAGGAGGGGDGEDGESRVIVDPAAVGTEAA
ncbi:hypothetical protein DFJ74DRAFT_664284 [Hyaloraphidium curvatum]|nr:hypothetical protein DFJ74DRAFT_664284 [Hyaloraphidium curvatum]